MQLKSLENCELSISFYPKFKYDASGGGGEGILSPPNDNGICPILFDINEFSIPPINRRTTKFLGIKLPPGLEITIKNQSLKGYLDIKTGDLSLDFIAKFKLSILKYIKAPDLIVETCLNSKEVLIQESKIKGTSIQKDGKTTLVGISTIKLTGNTILDRFLSLPTTALAILKCQVKELEYYEYKWDLQE